MKKSFTNIFFPGILIISVAFVFYPSIHCELTNWDTDYYIYHYPYLRSLSIENLKHIFGELLFVHDEPLTRLSFSVEYHFFGINPPVMHFINILLHLCNGLLVYYFIGAISRSQWAGFLTAILFSVHPLRVESVTWVVERKDGLYAFFYLAGLLAYYKYILSKSAATDPAGKINGKIQHEEIGKPFFKKHRCFYLLTVVCMILSCMSKGMGVSLALTLFVIDFYLKRKVQTGLFIEKIPFLLISVLFGTIALFCVDTRDWMSSYWEYSPVEKLLFSGFAFIFYFFKFFLPLRLSVYYPYLIPHGHLSGLFWIFPVIIFILGFLVIFSLKYTRKITFGAGIFVSTVIFILPFHNVNQSIVYERYTYLAHVGISFIIASAVLFLIKKNEIRKFFHPNLLRITFLGMLLLWMMFMGYLTRQRIDVWKDSFTLWSDYIRKFPNHFLGYLNRGTAYAVQGSYGKAIEDFNDAIALEPTNYKSLVNRGNAYALTKQYENAASDYTKALMLNDDKPEIYFNRGSARFFLTDTVGACEDWKKALEKGYGGAEVKIKKFCVD